MSELYKINKTTLEDIADALRSRSNSPYPIKVNEFASQIEALDNPHYNMHQYPIDPTDGLLFGEELAQEYNTIKIGAQCNYDQNISTISAYLPQTGTDQCSVRYGDYIYSFGGWTPSEGSSTGITIDTITKFNLKDETIQTLNPLPYLLSGAVGAVVRNKIYIIGGYSTDNGGTQASILVFDPATETVTDTGWDLPEPRLNGAVGVWGDDVYIVTGRNSDPLNTIIHLNPIKGILQQIEATLPQGCYYCGFAQDDEKVYILGGKTTESSKISLIQYFDHVTQTTGTITSLFYPFHGSPAIVIDNYLYFASATYSGSTKIMYLYQYNLLTNALTDITDKLGEKVACIGGVATKDNILYTLGGQMNDKNSTTFSNAIMKYIFTPVVPADTLFIHTSKKGQLCMPLKSNTLQVEVQVDKIYKGDTNNNGIALSGIQTYYNGKNIPVC